MKPPLVVATPGNEALAAAIAKSLAADLGSIETRSFPDGESYVRLVKEISTRRVVVVCTLDRPNDKLLPLIFAAATARELGAVSIGLVAPYLAYMRQDRRFQPGEAVTSRQVAELLSAKFDWLVTVDPHLHRYRSLSEIYSIPTRAVHAAPLIAAWIKQHVRHPVIIGPDSESAQWVSAVARDANAPYTVLEKVRHGDREVKISVKDLKSFNGRSPVLVDDIISSGRTMIEAVRILLERGATAPVCVAVHGLFADRSDVLLAEAGARVVTSTSISHETNGIDMTPFLAKAVSEFFDTGS